MFCNFSVYAQVFMWCFFLCVFVCVIVFCFYYFYVCVATSLCIYFLCNNVVVYLFFVCPSPRFCLSVFRAPLSVSWANVSPGLYNVRIYFVCVPLLPFLFVCLSRLSLCPR